MANFTNDETGTPFSHTQLSEAFDLVASAENWKLEICRVVPHRRDVSPALLKEMIREAVIFFAGCTPTFKDMGNSFHVHARGYYKVIGV